MKSLACRKVNGPVMSHSWYIHSRARAWTFLCWPAAQCLLNNPSSSQGGLMILQLVGCKQGQERIYSTNNSKINISIHIWCFHSLSFKSESFRYSIEQIRPKVLKIIMSSGNQVYSSLSLRLLLAPFILVSSEGQKHVRLPGVLGVCICPLSLWYWKGKAPLRDLQSTTRGLQRLTMTGTDGQHLVVQPPFRRSEEHTSEL